MEYIELNEDSYYTVSQAAKLLGVHPDTIYKKIRAGGLEVVKRPGSVIMIAGSSLKEIRTVDLI